LRSLCVTSLVAWLMFLVVGLLVVGLLGTRVLVAGVLVAGFLLWLWWVRLI
jgi:hypothetical protein